jgi:cell division septum initiation protein DivIVA
MSHSDLERLAEKVDHLVDGLKAARAESQGLRMERKRLEEKVAGLEKQLRHGQKEGDRLNELMAQNKAYKKRTALLKSRVVSMLARVEGVQ